MKKRTVPILESVAALAVALILVAGGCSQETVKGYEQSIPTYDEMPVDFCAYTAEKVEYDVDDVTIDFCFGFSSPFDRAESDFRDIPHAEIIFYNVADPNNKIVVGQIENYISDDYLCKVVTEDIPGVDDGWIIKEILFRHSEKITIPQELFTGEEGYIVFFIVGEDVNNVDRKKTDAGYRDYISGTGSCFPWLSYIKRGDTIILRQNDEQKPTIKKWEIQNEI
ncbi:MAG: hypothetical protein IJ735_01670 [Clostridia bacterium]|nr:hypothetical protein [Clostridia bacterium]